MTDFAVAVMVFVLASVGAGFIGSLLGEVVILIAQKRGWMSKRVFTIRRVMEDGEEIYRHDSGERPE